MRHFAQTEADRQRRVTESYSKAVEQLAHAQIEVRLGGIYTLERISRESPDDYWTVMETLCAFVRERARWKPEVIIPEAMQTPAVPTDTAAVLTVIFRRPEKERDREKREGWRLDLSGADLRGAKLARMHLEGADLEEAHLEGGWFTGAHLEGARLIGAHLEGANLSGAVG